MSQTNPRCHGSVTERNYNHEWIKHWSFILFQQLQISQHCNFYTISSWLHTLHKKWELGIIKFTKLFYININPHKHKLFSNHTHVKKTCRLLTRINKKVHYQLILQCQSSQRMKHCVWTLTDDTYNPFWIYGSSKAISFRWTKVLEQFFNQSKFK